MILFFGNLIKYTFRHGEGHSKIARCGLLGGEVVDCWVGKTIDITALNGKSEVVLVFCEHVSGKWANI